jgi:hypothetical protein
MIYENPMRVSRFYGADELSPRALEPLNYEIISPVEYEAAGHDKEYTIFVPPNLDLSDWLLDGKVAPEGFYVAWERQGRRVEYSRFMIYEASYIVSISSAIAIVIVYLLWRRWPLERKTRTILMMHSN